MKKVRQTRKPFKSNSNIIPNTVYEAGRLICQVASCVRPRVSVFRDAEDLAKNGRAKKSRDAMVMFECSLCPCVGLTRFDRLRDKIAKSCGCLEKLSDQEFQNSIYNWVRHLETKTRKEIFSSIILVGTIRTMQLYTKSKRELDTLYRYERDRMSLKFSSADYQAIHKIAQTNAIAKVAKHFKITVGEAMHIVRVADRALKDAKAAATAHWARMPAEQKEEVEEALHKGRKLMAQAIEAATDGLKEKPSGWFEEGRNWGEFTHAEYSTSGKYSYFGWLGDIAVMLPVDIALLLFGEAVGQFLEIVHRTENARSGRREGYLRNASRAKVAAKKVWREPARKGLYYVPLLDIKTIASALESCGLAL